MAESFELNFCVLCGEQFHVPMRRIAVRRSAVINNTQYIFGYCKPCNFQYLNASGRGAEHIISKRDNFLFNLDAQLSDGSAVAHVYGVSG